VKQAVSWVLVADGGTARVYRTTGETDTHRAWLEGVEGGEFTRLDPDHLASQSGKDMSRANGNSGHGIIDHEQVKRQAEVEFISAVLSWIGKGPHLHAFDQLVIVAPARTLGEIRKAMPSGLSGKIHREINGDLTKLPIKELERRVMASLQDIIPQ
jgi:protein required for attachment to host cells